GGETLDDDVSPSHELPDDVVRGRVCEIELDAELPRVAVGPQPTPFERERAAVGVERAGGAGDIGMRVALDVDDGGAEVGEEAPDVGPGNRPRHVEHAQPGEASAAAGVADLDVDARRGTSGRGRVIVAVREARGWSQRSQGR